MNNFPNIQILVSHELKLVGKQIHPKLLALDQVKITNSLSGKANAITKGNAGLFTF